MSQADYITLRNIKVIDLGRASPAQIAAFTRLCTHRVKIAIEFSRWKR
jgi:hypothetical protein